MAKERKKEPECEHGESAPLWIISFADLVTLLMSFFVVLAATSTQGGSASSSSDSSSSTNPAMERIAVAIRAAFRDLDPDEAQILAANAKFEDLLRKLEALAREGGPRHRGDSSEKGIYGEHFRVRQIRDGGEITMGGPVFFDLLSDQINPKGKEAIAQLGDLLRGHRSMLEIRGHAGDQPQPADWEFNDALELSHRRARNVADELIRLGIDPRTIRVTAIGPNEPVSRGSTDPAKLAEDRRVEIIVRESMLDDFATQKVHPTASPPTPRPVGLPSPGTPYKAETPATQPAEVPSHTPLSGSAKASSAP